MYINLRQLAVLENGYFGQPKKQIFGLDHKKKQIDAMTFSLNKNLPLFSVFHSRKLSRLRLEGRPHKLRILARNFDDFQIFWTRVAVTEILFYIWKI